MDKNRKSTKQRGITLISLIVTIIVLLILAGVPIIFLTGENGIIIKANEQKRLVDKVKEQEELDIELSEFVLKKRKTDVEMGEFVERLEDKDKVVESTENEDRNL